MSSMGIAFLVGFGINIAANVSAVTLLQAAPATVQDLYGLPRRMRNLGDLTPIIYRRDLSPLQKTNVLLTWLIAERQEPSPSVTGLGGGQIDSGYIQAQLAKGLGSVGYPLALDWLLSSPQIKDNGVRHAIVLALGRMGDQRQIAKTIMLLSSEQDPWYRALAAESLGLLGTNDVATALARALDDDSAVIAGNSHEGVFKMYPVREAAKEALRSFHNPTRTADAASRSAKFATTLRGNGAFAALHKPELAKLLAIATRTPREVVAAARRPSKRR